MAYAFQVYLAGDKEYFVYDENNRKRKIDFAFSQSLLDLLYLDIWAHGDLFEKMGKDLRELYSAKDEKLAASIKNTLDDVAELHIYFEFLRLDWYEKLNQAAVQGFDKISTLLPYKKLTHIPSDIHTIQEQINKLLFNVLDVSEGQDKSVQMRMVDYYKQNRPLLEVFSFEPLPVGFEPIDNIGFTDVLRPKSIYDIIDFFMRECIKREQLFKVCKNCGKYFTVSSYINTEYCERAYDDTGKTCKEIGATQAYKKKIQTDPVIGEYNRQYKKRFAWIRYRRITQEAFYAWSKEAQAMRDKALAGEITLEEFKQWLSK